MAAKINTEALSYLVIYINSGGIRWCNNLNLQQEKKSLFNVFAKECKPPLFFETSIKSIVNKFKPDMIIIGSSDEPDSKTYLHAELLPSRMPELGYVSIDRSKIDYIGDPNVESPSMRVSVFCKPNIRPNIMSHFTPYTYYDTGNDRKTGALSLHVNSSYGNLLFVLVDLPDTAYKLSSVNSTNVKEYRRSIRISNDLCLTNILNKLITPDIYHVVLYGDLNYEVYVDEINNKDIANRLYSEPKFQSKLYIDNDELKKQLNNHDSVLFDFKEGKAGSGISFLPTYPYNINRDPKCKGDKCYNVVFNNGIYPSWRDRVIYRDIPTANYHLYCSDYNSFSISTDDTHDAVYSTFEIVS